MMDFLPCVYAFFACIAFCIIFEVREFKFILSASFTGFSSWLVFVLTSFLGSSIWGETVRFLLATIVVTFLSEIFARILRAPSTIFLIIGIIPLVPGGGLYYTMDALITGNMQQFVYMGLKTAACAGAIAVGSSLVSSSFRIFTAALNSKNRRENI